MNLEEPIDVKENTVLNLDSELLSILLKDQTTHKNILWATDMYEFRGSEYSSSSEMTIEKITSFNGQVIRPRTMKSKKEQFLRVRDKAEVFTPSWLCNEQNNIADNQWFGSNNVFNKSLNQSWKPNKKKILFPSDKTWVDYVLSKRLEISCGEAPYLVSRYDTVSGKIIPIMSRIGLLDRKLRVICENTFSEEDWIKYSEQAYKSIYGFEWQGDSLLIARENLLYSFMDYYEYKFKKQADKEILKRIAEIISWNIFQMDGLKFVIPNSCKNEIKINYTLFGDEEIKTECLGCKKDNNSKHNGIYVQIMNWDTNRKMKFISLLKKRK